MIKTSNIGVKIVDSLIDPRVEKTDDPGKGCFKRHPNDQSRTYYKVYIYLEGQDLPFVKRVKYTLHKTFPNPVKVVERSPNNPYCMLIIWTWGLFNIKVEIEDARGKLIKMDHFLTYGNQIKEGNIEMEEQKY